MRTTSKVLIALSAGLAVGAVLGILFAPDKGSSTRQKIAETPNKLAEKFKNKLNSLIGESEEKLQKVNGKMEETVV